MHDIEKAKEFHKRPRGRMEEQQRPAVILKRINRTPRRGPCDVRRSV